MLLRLAPFFLLLFPLISCQKQAELRAKNIVVYEVDGNGENGLGEEGIALENEFLSLHFLPASAEIILLDRKSGTEWRSSPLGTADDPGADAITRQLMMSQFSLQYADVSGVGMTLYSNEHSVSRGAYNYSLSGGVLEVNYTVGDLEKSYLFPAAAREDRMLPFLEKMPREDRRRIESSYRLYDINNLRESDNKNELLSLYPDLGRAKVYVLRDNTQEYMKAQIEEYFAEAGYTWDDYLEDNSRYASGSGADSPAFNVTLRYRLDGRSLVVSAPFDSIAYRPSYPITQLSLLPFMGAGGVEDEGYLFVPDGSGAIIKFNNGKQNQIAYSNNVYGWDEAMPRDAIVGDSKAPYPAYGIQKNGAALLCLIEDGSAYASVKADVSGRNCSWNSVYGSFEMIHGAIMDISGRSDRAVYLYQSGLPEGESISIRYTPCAQSGYVGMAKEYRSWLMEKYPELGNNIGENVPVAVEIVGAVNKTMHRLGIPFDLPLKLTSYREMENMIRNFSSYGWKDVYVKPNGWFNRSVEHSVPTKIRVIPALGGRVAFSTMVSLTSQFDSGLYPEVDFLYMRDLSALDGFSLYRDAARYVNRKRIEKYPYSVVWFGERTQWGKLSYISRPQSMLRMINRYSEEAAGFGINNIAFRNIGSQLSGDYNEKRFTSREAAMKMRQDVLSELSQSGTRMLIETGFAYSVPWASFITGMALEDQGFGITDEAVPFYQIVLHGLVPYTGKAINLAEDYTKNLLKTIECGAGLYFSFMTEETAVLQETKYRQFFANEYDKWFGDANYLYRKFQDDFGSLSRLAIVNHEILGPGVRITEYENGTKVIVNSGVNAWQYREADGKEAIVIGPNDYLVTGRGN